MTLESSGLVCTLDFRISIESRKVASSLLSLLAEETSLMILIFLFFHHSCSLSSDEEFPIISFVNKLRSVNGKPEAHCQSNKALY
jgi:hypothetical protein